jgi:hypothetical protein
MCLAMLASASEPVAPVSECAVPSAEWESLPHHKSKVDAWRALREDPKSYVVRR